MPLEDAQFIDGLNLSAPNELDFRSEGDDHFRMFKRAVKQSFPGLAGRSWRVQNRSASGPIALTDNMCLLNAGTITLTPDAASVLGNGFLSFIRASSGNVVVNPVENINGVGQMTIPAGYTGILMCDGAEFFMMLVFQDVPSEVKAFPTGTKMPFHQTAAPVGWTKLVGSQYNDAALRVTTGTAGTGGLDAFTATFGAGKTVGQTTLTESQIPPHLHSYTGHAGLGASGTGGNAQLSTAAANTGSTGGGGSHLHTLSNMDIKFVDFIVASID